MQGEPRGHRLNPQAEDDWSATGSGAARRDSGVQQVRRISTWGAAALVASVAASAGYFAHAVAPPTSAVGGSSVNGTAGTPTVQKPSLTHPVVSSGGSGVVAGTGGAASSGAAGRGAVHWADN